MKNNKGITMLSLAIIVILMVLLATVTAYESRGLITIARMESVTTDLLLVQAKVRIINEQVNFETEEDAKENLKKGTKLSLAQNAGILSTLTRNNVITTEDDPEDFYLLARNDLVEMKLDNLNAESGYVVNYKTEEVIYSLGIKDSNGNYVYKLSDLIEKNAN